jgi:hypothetical protein
VSPPHTQETAATRKTLASFGPVSQSQKVSRKWIRRRIEQLDPYADYAEIWALSYIYNVTDFELHWVFTLANPHLGVTQWGAEASYRGGQGALVVQAEARAANTNDHMLLWAEHGPESPVTAKAVDIVNKLHAKWAKPYPGAFSHSDDFVYLFSDAATAEDTLRRSLGLPGWSAKQKIAAHRYWCELASLFTVEGGAKLTDVDKMPESFDAMAAYAEAYLARPWPDNPVGAAFTEALLDECTRRWFPRPLRPFGRALVTSFFAPSLFRAYKMSPPNRMMRTLARATIWAMIVYSDYIRADEKEPITERRRLVAKQRVPPSAIDTTVHRAVQKESPGGACPHMRVR